MATRRREHHAGSFIREYVRDAADRLYLGLSFNKFGTKFWGLPLPQWGWDDKELRHVFFTIHGYLAWIMIAFIALHFLGAVKHQLIDRDSLLRRNMVVKIRVLGSSAGGAAFRNGIATAAIAMACAAARSRHARERSYPLR